jgi:P pilus assembly chaperone PapD
LFGFFYTFIFEKKYIMKTKLLSALFGIVLSCFLLSFNQQKATCSLLLTNAKTNKSINICEKNSVQKIEAVLGGAISLDKELPDDKEPPIFTFTYDGLVIEMQNDQISNVSITNTKWKLNTATVGITIAQMTTKFERSEFDYFGNPRFKVKDSKAIVFTEIDKASKVKKIGVVF